MQWARCVTYVWPYEKSRIQLTDRVQPNENHVKVMTEKYGRDSAPLRPQLFGTAGREHMEKYGTKREIFAKIAYKNHKHSVHNPYVLLCVLY